MPERIKFDLCKCNWQDCAEIQEQIARYCFESGKSHPQLGFLTIANEHELLRKSMLRHLQMDPALPVKIRIARHHFHPDRMALYGNKAWVLEFDGEQKILKKLNGTREWKQMQKLLEKEEAAKFGIQDDSEKVARKDKKSGYICAPIFSRNAVRIALRALSDPSSRSRHQKRRHGESMVDLIQEQSSEIVLPAKEVPLLPTLTTEPSGANISNNDDAPRRPLLETFDMSDPATWAVPPTTLSSIINAETQKHIKIDNDNKINLEPSHLRQSMVFRSALLLYTKFFHCYNEIEIRCSPALPSSKSLFLRPCESPIHANCESFRILRKRGSSSTGLCQVCYWAKVNLEKARDRSKHPSLQVQKKNNRYCTTEEHLVRAAENASKKKVASKAVKRAREKVRLLKQQHSMSVTASDRELKCLFESASKYIKDNKKTALESLMAAVTEQMLHKDKSTNKQEREEEAALLANDINTWSAQCNSGSRRVRYNPRTMRIALSLFMANPKGYEQWKQSKIEPWPSISRLKQLKRQLTPEEGSFPLIFAWFQDAFRKRGYLDQPGKLIGQILCDRLKLRSEFYLNPATLCTQGIVVSDFSDKVELSEEVCKLFEEDKDGGDDDKMSNEDDYSCSIYVNQFRFRSIQNLTSTGPFFFDNGSVSGDEILRQMKQVIMGFEMARATIVGVGMDGGGENMRGAKLARDGNDPKPEDKWLKDEQCSFINPADPSRRVAFVLCSTHNAKAGRNTLLNSGHEKDGTGRSDYKRDFLFEGVRFGWATIDRCWKREQKKVVRDTRLTGESAHPDQWNKMSAKLVKDVFDPDTLREILCHIWTTIELANEKCDFLWSSSTKANNDAKQILSYIPELKQKFLKIMRS